MAKPWHRWPPPLKSPDGPLRLWIYERDGGACAIRGPGCTTTPTVLDHIVRPQDGGAWFDPNNLRAACHPCNTRRRKTLTGHPQPTAPSNLW